MTEVVRNLARRVWTGHYTFPLAMLPQNEAVGWKLGSSRLRRRGDRNGGVELLLDVPHSSQVRGVHARFNWHRTNGLFLVYANHSTPSGVLMEDESFEKGEYRAFNRRTMRTQLDYNKAEEDLQQRIQLLYYRCLFFR